MKDIYCPLCSGSSALYYQHRHRKFLRCSNCCAIFLDPDNYLTPEEEKAHYMCHNNNPDDRGYQNFVRPVVNHILRDFEATDHGLDFGSGTGSPIVKLLEDNGYNISQYDLYFHNNTEMLQKKYHYIACSEVAEHFKRPYKEFEMLKNLLLPCGKLYIMTGILKDEQDFGSWHYKNDHTHVFLYHPSTFKWIKNTFGFREINIEERVVTLSL